LNWNWIFSRFTFQLYCSGPTALVKRLNKFWLTFLFNVFILL